MELPIPITTIEQYQKLENENMSDSKNAASYFSKPAYKDLPQVNPAAIKNYLAESGGYSLPVPYPAYLKKAYMTKFGDNEAEEEHTPKQPVHTVPPSPVPPVLPPPAPPADPVLPPVQPPPVQPPPVPRAPVARTKIKIGGETVDLLDDEICCVLRDRDGVTEDWLLERNFTFRALADGGGKGGSLMQITADERLLVKALNSEDSLGMQLILPAYARHLSSNPNSLLARFYYHFRRSDGTVYCVMSSCMPKGNLHEKLDLKGSADDKMLIQDGTAVKQVHKRFYNIPWLAAEACCNSAGVPPERQRYAQGKRKAREYRIQLGAKAADVCRTIQADVKFLMEAGVMDYSLLVGKMVAPVGPGDQQPAFPAGGVHLHGQPVVVREGNVYHAYYFGIIDFLQTWTNKKKAANIIKTVFAPKPISTVPPKQYGEQFLAANQLWFQSQK